MLKQKDAQNHVCYQWFKKHFSHALTASLDIDSVEAIAIHKKIINENALLWRHYAHIYLYFKKVEESLAAFKLPSLEIGSGGGFIKEYLPDCITSDVARSEGVDKVENALSLSFADSSLKAIYANGVVHHLEDPVRCIREAERVLVKGGMFVCNEPSLTPFGYMMNKFFHKEHTDIHACDWEHSGFQGRLSSANMAIPYIIFKKDRKLFQKTFPNLEIVSFLYHDFLRYTLSGGLSFKPFVPPQLFTAVNALENVLSPCMPLVGNNMIVVIRKIN